MLRGEEPGAAGRGRAAAARAWSEPRGRVAWGLVPSFSHSVELSQPPDQVFPWLLEEDKVPQWTSALESYSVRRRRSGAARTCVQTLDVAGGIKLDMEITRYDPPSGAQTRFETNGVKVTSGYTLRAVRRRHQADPDARRQGRRADRADADPGRAGAAGEEAHRGPRAAARGAAEADACAPSSLAIAVLLLALAGGGRAQDVERGGGGAARATPSTSTRRGGRRRDRRRPRSSRRIRRQRRVGVRRRAAGERGRGHDARRDADARCTTQARPQGHLRARHRPRVPCRVRRRRSDAPTKASGRAARLTRTTSRPRSRTSSAALDDGGASSASGQWVGIGVIALIVLILLGIIAIFVGIVVAIVRGDPQPPAQARAGARGRSSETVRDELIALGEDIRAARARRADAGRRRRRPSARLRVAPSRPTSAPTGSGRRRASPRDLQARRGGARGGPLRDAVGARGVLAGRTAAGASRAVLLRPAPRPLRAATCLWCAARWNAA